MFAHGSHNDHRPHGSQPDEAQKYETWQLHELIRIKKARYSLSLPLQNFKDLLKVQPLRHEGTKKTNMKFAFVMSYPSVK
jgi:hypothetical protein